MAKQYATINDNGLILNLEKLPQKLHEALLDETWRQSIRLTNYIIRTHLTGGTSATKLAVRSGMLRRTTLEIDPRQGSHTTKKIHGGTRFGAFYANIHVGPKGQVTVIRPIHKKYLHFPIYSKGGMALSTAKWVKVKESRVPSRVHPDEIMAVRLPFIAKGFNERIESELEKHL